MKKNITSTILMSLLFLCLNAQNLEVDGNTFITGKLGLGINNPQQKMDIRGTGTDDGALLSLGNSDLSHKLLFFPGRENDPFPFIQWKDGDPLRFATDG